MKYILKLLMGMCFMPFIILGGLIAVLETIIAIPFGFAWQKGDEWHGKMLMKLRKFMQWMK